MLTYFDENKLTCLSKEAPNRHVSKKKKKKRIAFLFINENVKKNSH